MVPEITLLGASLALGVSSGLLAHEGTHALALHLSGIPYRVKILPHRDGHPIRWLARTPWAVVLPAPRPATPTWAIQLGALAPLLLAVPLFTLAALGHTPTATSPVQLSFALGWFACAIPSPQDFSVAFYADQALESVALDDAESGTGTHR
ncbi:hypothetical protein Halru_1875 [Halovivax ruber XH-70]|uniref:Uncharacterized protein n=1 Tax=Halovivax ruber (strain DSM 18193 / JCM 13892 / XH-70) TaxID=797302 RepID=L0ICJ3_HALRX|nr:hypothetical protein [Halovivax ruber]AGB16474.1 hypothetical protein Halru_1875 [Halovivax ruber XH-70]